jgi:energy-coupling factor transport system ATP-binding protein
VGGGVVAGAVIELDGVSFAYGLADGDGLRAAQADAPGSGLEPALRDVALTVAPGEVVVLCGPSGCGKTTVTRLVNGLIGDGRGGAARGRVTVGGLDPGTAPVGRLACHVGSVFQDPRTQFFTTDVASELAFGLENLGVPADRIRRRIAAVAEDWGLSGLTDRSVFALSGGEKQRVICAAVHALDPPALVLDEPSANLDAAATACLAESVARWKAEGKAVLIAEHRLAYLTPVADRFIRLEAGRVTHRFDTSQLSSLGDDRLAALDLRPLTGPSDDNSSHPHGFAAPGQADAAAQSRAVPPLAAEFAVEVRDFAYWRPPRARRARAELVSTVDRLAARQGEVVAVTGPNGAGKTTLSRWVAGVARGGRGELRVGAEKWRERRRLTGVALVGQNVNQQLFAQTARDEVLLANRRLDPAGADAILTRFDLDRLAGRHPLALSGGERQRLAIAAAFAQDRPVVVLDEPTSGLDLLHMRQVAAGIEELAAAGRTVLVATHDQDLIAACGARVQPLG